MQEFPVKFNVEKFIEENFDNILNKLHEHHEFIIKSYLLDIKTGIQEQSAINENGNITFFIQSIEFAVSMLETMKAQQTWIILLIYHEILHSVYNKMENESQEDYEKRMNRNVLLNATVLSRQYDTKYLYQEYLRRGTNDKKVWDILLFGLENYKSND